MSSEKPNNAIYQVRGINPQRLEAILENAGSSILDVGCGNGAYVLKLSKENPAFKIKGVDYQRFETWKEAPDLFILADAEKLPFEDQSFETVTLFEVLEHLENPVKYLKEYLRVCRKNLILTVPNCEISTAMKQSLITYYHYTDSTHVNFFTMDSLLKVVEEAGFKIKKNYYINKLSLMPIISEAYDLKKDFKGKFIHKLLSGRKSKDYYITCLVVAEK